MLDFRMDTFLAVCRHMNYTKAARELNLTQPGVSQHIRWLEEQYGAKLFTYANKRLSLTPEGERLRNMALSMKHDTQSLQRSFREPGPLAQRLVMGVTPTVGMYLIPHPLARYHRAYPQAPISLRVSNTQSLCRPWTGGSWTWPLWRATSAKATTTPSSTRREPLPGCVRGQLPV